MTEPEWKHATLRGVGIALLIVFVASYAVSITEFALSFTPKGRDGPILELYKILGYRWENAGYNMMLVLTVLLMVGAVAGYHGAKMVRYVYSMSK